MKTSIMWAVYNEDIGFYVDTCLTRQEMIDKHTEDLRVTWDVCQRNGDKVMRVKISPAQQSVERTPSKRGETAKVVFVSKRY